jgi:hypothetical protein
MNKLSDIILTFSWVFKKSIQLYKKKIYQFFYALHLFKRLFLKKIILIITYQYIEYDIEKKNTQNIVSK